eukprot:scaffold5281_cov127-Cylindrotheca_fusiformis.AAC.7
MSTSSPSSTSTYSSTRSPTAVDISEDTVQKLEKDQQDKEHRMWRTDLIRPRGNGDSTMTSVKSAAISATAASTRKSKRPGQAKVRLQQQEVGEAARAARRISSQQSQRGWQETMKRAALATNQTWDANHGFRGHKADTLGSPSDERLQIFQNVPYPPRINRSHRRPQTQAPLMIGAEGEDERINILETGHGGGLYFEI